MQCSCESINASILICMPVRDAKSAMIDTVVLSVPMDGLTPCDDSKEWEDWELNANRAGFRRYIKHPPKDDVEAGMYFPTLTGYRTWDRTKGGISRILIQFSAPKLVYGQNLDELSDRHFETVITLLQDRMARMGLDISEALLRKAEVSKIHYSKNFLLEGGFTASYVIERLWKINLDQRIGRTNTKYANDGEGLHMQTKQYGISIYDKTAELRHGLEADVLKTLSLSHNVVRLEVRFMHKAKLRTFLGDLGLHGPLTFRKLFSSKVSKAVLMRFWDGMISKDAVTLFSRQGSAKEILRDVLVVQRGIRPVRAIYLVGLIILSQDGGGIRELRAILANHGVRETWYRLVKSLRQIGDDLATLRPEEWFEQMEAQLKAYKPVRLLGKINRQK